MAYYNPYMGYQPQQLYNAQPQQTQQIQNGGFVSVANEMIARNYPVAPGNSVTFKDENAPYIYTKTMGFSQLDTPIFEKYKLIKEDDVQSVQQIQNNSTDFENIKIQFEEYRKQTDDNLSKLWGELDVFKQQLKTPTTEKKKNGGD